MKTVSAAELENIKAGGATVRAIPLPEPIRPASENDVGILRGLAAAFQGMAARADDVRALVDSANAARETADSALRIAQSAASEARGVARSIEAIPSETEKALKKAIASLPKGDAKEIHHHPVIERTEVPVHTIETRVEKVVETRTIPPKSRAFDIELDRGRIVKAESKDMVCYVKYDRAGDPVRLEVQPKE